MAEPWADQPFALNPIKMLKTNTPESRLIAAEMANAHNCLLRSLNSIYNQAPYVRDEKDIHDLLQYSLFWIDWIEHHHDAEEDLFFPEVEHITGDVGLMSRNVEQHHAFLPGVEALKKYTKDCFAEESKEKYDGKKYQAIIQSFAPILSEHLKDEVVTLCGLDVWKGKQAALKKAFVDFDSKLREGEKSILFPLVMGSADAEFEGEPLWPAVPGFLRYVIHYYFERQYQSVWRFSPSDTWGIRQKVAFGPEFA